VPMINSIGVGIMFTICMWTPSRSSC
jgi:hypothetical protein